MKIIIADEAGFCFGVKRASDLVLKESKKGKKINTYGPLIHNNEFIKHLEERNIFSVPEISQIDASSVVIRSHGITKQEEGQLREKGFEIIDATCPFVKRVHTLANTLENEGYKLLVFGEEEHPEVKGIISYAKKPILIKSTGDIPEFPADQKIALISQTTQNLKMFKEISDYLQKKYKNSKIINTICDATEKRQNAAKKLSKEVDVMIVIGGKHSSNTSRLREVCSENISTYHIETAKELKRDWFKNAKTVGITAGASTPDFIIKEIIKKIKTYAD